MKYRFQTFLFATRGSPSSLSLGLALMKFCKVCQQLVDVSAVWLVSINADPVGRMENYYRVTLGLET